MNGRFFLVVALLLLTACQLGNSPSSAQILYLGWDAQEEWQLFHTPVEQPRPTQLTQLAGGISEYALASDRRQIAMVTQAGIELANLNGRLSLSTPERLLSCDTFACSQLVWAPDSRRLIFERREWQHGVLQAPSLWWLDTATGEILPVLEETTQSAQAASISPDGQWLTYAVPSEERLYAFNLENGRFFSVQSMMGTAAVWHSDSQQFVLNDLNLVVLHEDDDDDHTDHAHDFDQGIHLFLADIFSESRRAITVGANVDDSQPVWSPNGEWILFGRKVLRTNAGRQLWLVRADGSQERPLTNELTIHHGVPSWSPDGKQILFQQVRVNELDKRPSIWLYDTETEEFHQIVAQGIQPSWVSIP